MIHRSIVFQNVALTFPHKVCFEGLTTQISYGSRIAIIGRNGSGKSTLLKMLQGMVEPSDGFVRVPDDVVFGYVPQTVQDFDDVSGGQRFNKALTGVLAQDPNVLLLDEPTNHLDLSNRRSLMRMLRNFQGTLIIVSHDVELLKTCVDTLWHIDEGRIEFVSGGYENFVASLLNQREKLESQLSLLKREQKQSHLGLMREQDRAKKRKIQGEKRYAGDTIALRAAQGSGQRTMNKNKGRLAEDKQDILEQLANIRVSEIITPKFSLEAKDLGAGALVSVSDGSCGYEQPVLSEISLSIGSHERVILKGDNGSGKSTLVKAILGDFQVACLGNWLMPKQADIGYLDQHYKNVDDQKTVFETIRSLMKDGSDADVRSHLNDFLFRKNEEVMALGSTLSGGEKVRLSLACIAAKTPKLLILDEITNNLDLETREYVIQVLKGYPGAMIIISHDEDFVRSVGVDTVYEIKHGKLKFNV